MKLDKNAVIETTTHDITLASKEGAIHRTYFNIVLGVLNLWISIAVAGDPYVPFLIAILPPMAVGMLILTSFYSLLKDRVTWAEFKAPLVSVVNRVEGWIK